MFQSIPMSDLIELPKGLEDFPKEVRIVLDNRNEKNPILLTENDFGQSYYHWSILNKFEFKVNFEKLSNDVVIGLSKILTKLDDEKNKESKISISEIQSDIKKILVDVCKKL